MNPINELTFKLSPREKTKRLSSTLSISNTILFSNAKYFSGVEFGIISLLLLYEKTHAEKESFSNNKYTVKKIAASLSITEDGVRKALKKLIAKNVLIISDGNAILNFDNLNIPKNITIETPDYTVTTTAPVEFTAPTVTSPIIPKCQTVIEQPVVASNPVSIPEPVPAVISAPVEVVEEVIEKVINNFAESFEALNNEKTQRDIENKVAENFSKYFDSSCEPITQKEPEPYKAPEWHKPITIKFNSKFISQYDEKKLIEFNNIYQYFINLNEFNKTITKELFEKLYFLSYYCNNEFCQRNIKTNKEFIYMSVISSTEKNNICNNISMNLTNLLPKIEKNEKLIKKYILPELLLEAC